MDLTESELQTIADELGVSLADLQSEAVKDCAESVKADNPDMTKQEAFAVCQDMENQGDLQAPHVALAEQQDPGAITRDEEEDGTVRYGNVLLLAPGVWGDAGSGKRILYSEEGIANSADNWTDDTVNLFHEREDETAEIGSVDTDSVYLGDDDGGLYGDFVLHMDNPASEFADEALQSALESGGDEGLQGPSVELRGEDYRFNADRGVHELVEGTFNGLGLVGLGVSPGPGSKDAAFAEQTKERAVALASDEAADVLRPTTHAIMDINDLRERLEAEGVTLAADADEDDLRSLAAALDIDLQDDEDGDGDDMDGDDEEMDGDGEADDDADPDDDGDDDVDVNLEDVAGRVDDIASQVSENAERIDSMAQQFEELDDGSNLSDLFDTVSDVTETLETLAEADTVAEIESRLSDLEDEPEDPTSLADVGGAEATSDDERPVRDELGPNAPGKAQVRR
jgi:hypothetical protein